MSLVGQPTGGSITPGGSGADNTISGYGPTDEAGAPKFSLSETRELQQKFGEPPVHTRKFKAVQEIYANSQSARSDIAQFVNAYKGARHPEFPGTVCTEMTSVESVETTETSKKLITEITAVYTVPEEEEPDQDPLSKPDIWTFQTQGASIAAFYYFDGNDQKPITNSAGDYIKGLQGDEAQTKVVIKGNRATFPAAVATALTNCVNGDTFLGGGQDKWKCQGITGQLKYDTVNEVTVKYWEITVELLYRQTGWNLLLPDIGFNYIEGGQRKRAMVYDDQNKEWIASAEPVALNGSGALVANGIPQVLTRRIYRRVNFSNYFGTPPA